MAGKTRKVHVLDDDREPEGPLLCGKTSRQVLGGDLEKGDVLCRKCAMALLMRLNEYAGQIDVLNEIVNERGDTVRQLRWKVARSERMVLDLLERFLDAEAPMP